MKPEIRNLRPLIEYAYAAANIDRDRLEAEYAYLTRISICHTHTLSLSRARTPIRTLNQELKSDELEIRKLKPDMRNLRPLKEYKDGSRMRKRNPLGLYRRPMPKILGRS